MNTIIRNDSHTNVDFSIRRYPNELVSRVYHPKNMTEVNRLMKYFMVKEHCPTEYGIEITYENWDDAYFTKLGAIMITPVIFNVIDSYTYLYVKSQHLDERTIEFCGKDKIYVKLDINNAPFSEFIGMIEDIKTSVEFRSIWDVINYSFSKFFSDTSYYASITSFDDVIRRNNTIMSDANNIKVSLALFLIKTFALYNPLMQDRQFINNKNVGLIGLVSDSLFPNKISERCGMYGSYVLGTYARNLYNYSLHYTQLCGRLIDSERKSSVMIDAHSRYIVFNECFIERAKSRMGLVVNYHGKMYMVLEDDSQIPFIKAYSQNPSNIPYNILFVKHLDKKYKISLLKAGSGGYDMIEAKHL